MRLLGEVLYDTDKDIIILRLGNNDYTFKPAITYLDFLQELLIFGVRVKAMMASYRQQDVQQAIAEAETIIKQAQQKED